MDFIGFYQHRWIKFEYLCNEKRLFHLEKRFLYSIILRIWVCTLASISWENGRENENKLQKHCFWHKSRRFSSKSASKSTKLFFLQIWSNHLNFAFPEPYIISSLKCKSKWINFILFSDLVSWYWETIHVTHLLHRLFQKVSTTRTLSAKK